MKNLLIKKLIKNISVAFIVQFVSTLVSIVIGFVVPKFISELTYSRWQVYFLYSFFNSLFQFGVLDGILIRNSSNDCGQLDHKLFRTQLHFINIIQLFFLIVFTGCFTLFSLENVLLCFLVFISIIIRNIYCYFTYVFQVNNDIKEYSIVTLIERLSYCFLIIILLIFKSNSYYLYCLADIIGYLIGVLYAVFKRKNFFFGSLKIDKHFFDELITNIKVGGLVMLSTFSYSFIINGAKTVVQWKWDELTYGQFSFSINIFNTLLGFIIIISVVLFPSLKRMTEEMIGKLYKTIREIIFIIIILCIVLYLLFKNIILFWLPNYYIALTYFDYILPSLIFMSKAQILANSYLKVYREERKMLFIYMITLVFTLSLYIISAYYFNNIYILSISILIGSIVTLFLLEKIIIKKIFINIKFCQAFDVIYAFMYVMIITVFPDYVVVIFSILLIAVYLIYRKEVLKKMFKNIFNGGN